MNEEDHKIPGISVLIPTLNGGELFESLLESLYAQTVTPLEIIVADSESEDNTLEICRKFGVITHTIKRAEFDHGGTRTRLAKLARGTVVVYFTQDAVPSDNWALEKLIAPLKNAHIGCSFGRQLAGEDATIFAEHLRLFNYPSASDVRSYKDRYRLGFRTTFMSNSFSAYKKDVLADVGYFKNGLIFGEDTCTVGKILKAGFDVAYCAEATVTHSHNYSISGEFKRSYDIGVLHASEKWLVDEFGKAEGIGKKYVKSLLKTISEQKRYGLYLPCALRVAAKFSGYKLGRLYSRQPNWLRTYCSMNSNWWLTDRA